MQDAQPRRLRSAAVVLLLSSLPWHASGEVDSCEAVDDAGLLQTLRGQTPRGETLRGDALQREAWSSRRPESGAAGRAEEAPHTAPPHRHPSQDGFTAALAFLGLGLLGVGLQVMLAECLLLDHGGLCRILLMPLSFLPDARGLFGRCQGRLTAAGTSCCSGGRQEGPQATKATAEEGAFSILKRLPPETGLVVEVASWLSASELCRLGAASRDFRPLPDQACSTKELMAEVQHRGLERELRRELELGGVADTATEEQAMKVPPVVLRRFLTMHSMRLLLEEQELLATRRWQALRDLLKFLLLGICWVSFLCQVTKLAHEGKDPSAAMALKAIVSPFLFLYVLENAEQRLVRCFLATLIAALLFYDCVSERPLGGKLWRWHPYVVQTYAPQVAGSGHK